MVAEGVETAEQVAFLQKHGCDQYQGYYFSRPVEAAAFAELLRTGASADGDSTSDAERTQSRLALIGRGRLER